MCILYSVATSLVATLLSGRVNIQPLVLHHSGRSKPAIEQWQWNRLRSCLGLTAKTIIF